MWYNIKDLMRYCINYIMLFSIKYVIIIVSSISCNIVSNYLFITVDRILCDIVPII